MRYRFGSNSKTICSFLTVARLLVAAILISCTAVCHADVTIVWRTARTGSLSNKKPAAAPHSSLTTIYIHGNKLRCEAGKIVYLYDSASKIRYRVNMTRKTYSIAPRTMSGMGDVANKIKIDGHTSIAPTGVTERVAGVTAKEYRYKTTLFASLKNPPATNGATAPLLTSTIEGMQWVASVPGISEQQNAAMSEVRGMNQVTATIPGMASFMKPLESLKGSFIGQHQVITLHKSAIIGGGPDASMTIDTTTTSISHSALSESLFEIPVGFKYVEPSTKAATSSAGSRYAPAAPAAR